MNKTPGQVTISFEYLRHLGPRYVHGAVCLRFDAFRPYSFRSDAKWPAKDNFELAVKEAVETALKKRLGSLKDVEVVLESVTFDPVHFSEVGFRNAARAATEAAFTA